MLHHKITGTGSPLVILHGLFGSLDNWTTVGKQMAEDYKVILVDLRNHGQSFHHQQFDYHSMAEDIKQLIDTLELDDVAILGHSMGGKAAMFFADRYAEQLENLIIVDIAPKHYPVHHRTILDGLKSIELHSINSRTQADDQLKAYIPEAPVRQFLLKNLKRTKNGFEWKINLPVLDQQIENVGEALPDLSTVDTRTLFIKGGGSDYISEEDKNSIGRQFPNSRVATVEGAGHWVHAEAPEELIDLVGGFLNAH